MSISRFRESIWFWMLLIFMLLIVVIVLIQLIRSLEEHLLYNIDGGGKSFCKNNSMNYTVYLNGNKYCDDGKYLHPITSVGNSFRFVSTDKGRDRK